MALIDTYRSTLQRKQEDLAKLSSEKAKLQRKLSQYTVKAQNAANSATRASNSSNLSSKLREVARHEKCIAQETDKLAKLEGKIAAKHKELQSVQKKLTEQEQRRDKERQLESKRRRNKHEQQLRAVDGILSLHNRLHASTQLELERLNKLPETIAVAVFAANPLDQNSLRLDEEVRSIQEMLRKAEHRSSVKLLSFWAVRPLDILQALNECSPAIVHFSGHGSENDKLVLQDNSGGTKFVSKEAIVQAMVTAAEGIRLVFFNTCYSHDQAALVVQHVEAAIGMGDSISDDAARVFSSQFYSAVGFGLSVGKAFLQARTALMLEGIREEDTPELFCQDGIDPDDVVIVRPPCVEQTRYPDC